MISPTPNEMKTERINDTGTNIFLWESAAAAALRYVARDEDIKAYIQKDSLLYNTLLRAASRFIGGETLPQCLEVAAALNRKGFAVTIDYMGESTRDASAAEQATAEYLRIAQEIKTRGLNASISLDLSHIGLVVDEGLGFDNASRLAEAATLAGTEMMISMEGSERTSAVLDVHRRLCECFDNVGITLQAYLYRTQKDLAAALERPGKIRLVKGAFGEPSELARARGEELDTFYRDAMHALLASGHLCSIATHDSVMLKHAHEFTRQHNLDRQFFEFEMLHGATSDRLQQMLDKGYKVRDYLPYGKEWYLYLCHRLAEYPPNIYRALADAVGNTLNCGSLIS
jgi:proline dehydrogenase